MAYNDPFSLLSFHFPIDFSINGLSTENCLRPQRTPTPYKIKVKNCKLIDLMIRIKFTRAILMPWFPNFLKTSIMHFRMFLYLVTCFLRVTVSLLCWSQAVSKIHVRIYPYRRKTKLFDLVTGTTTKPCLSGNMLPNIKTF